MRKSVASTRDTKVLMKGLRNMVYAVTSRSAKSPGRVGGRDKEVPVDAFSARQHFRLERMLVSSLRANHWNHAIYPTLTRSSPNPYALARICNLYRWFFISPLHGISIVQAFRRPVFSSKWANRICGRRSRTFICMYMNSGYYRKWYLDPVNSNK